MRWSSVSTFTTQGFRYALELLLTVLEVRNIMLFSLIIDEASPTSIWNIFYHLYIPDADIVLLQVHADKLLLQSDSISSWISAV